MTETDCCYKRGANPPAGVEDYWRKPKIGDLNARVCSFCLSLKPSDVLKLLDLSPQYALEGAGEVKQLVGLPEGSAEHIPLGPVHLQHFDDDEKAELTEILASRAELK